jgi:hypothetical protein
MVDRGNYQSLVLVRVSSKPEAEKEGPLLGYVLQRLPRDEYDLISMGRRQQSSPLMTARAALIRELNANPFLKGVGNWEAEGQQRFLYLTEILWDDWKWLRRPEDSGAHYLTTDQFYEVVRAGRFNQANFAQLVERGLIMPLGRDKVAPAAA